MNAQPNISTHQLAKGIRRHALKMVSAAKASHIGGALSIADILAVLYADVLAISPEHPDHEERDRLIVSKGHAGAAVYAALALKGFFPVEWLERYASNNQPLAGHLTAKGVPGVEFSSGALGHGLSVGCGMALAAKARASKWQVFVLLSDGECNEGSIWEADMFATHNKLDNLVVIVDVNRLQGLGYTCDVIDMEPLASKWTAFGWHVEDVDGHNHDALQKSFSSALQKKAQPSVILARTIKGKGIDFMEDQLLWHYKSPDDLELQLALKQIPLDE